MGWHYAYGPMMGGFGDYGSYGLISFLLSAAWIIVLIVLAVAAFRFILGRRGQHRAFDWGHSSSALDILRERYAKGEIDRAEFEEKKKDLS